MSQVNSGLTDLQAGKLLADVEHVREIQSEQGMLLKEINEKLGDHVKRSELEEYKNEVEENYLRKDEVKGLLAFWNVATGRFTRIVVNTAIVGIIIVAAISMLQSIPITKPILDKVTRVKEG